jgi:hypothetical protein
MAIDADFATKTTTDPHYADKHEFYKVELWTKNHVHVRPAAARRQSYRQATEFVAAVKRRPRGRYTIRQRTRVVESGPR